MLSIKQSLAVIACLDLGTMAKPGVYLLSRFLHSVFSWAVTWSGCRLTWLVPCYFVVMTTATASMINPLVFADKAFGHVSIATVGYRAPWLRHLRERAQRASKANEPYLANRYWRLLAGAGDRIAAFRLGLYYDIRGNSDADARRAVYWYQRAAQAGEIHAEHNLGVAYAAGKGVTMDIRQTIKWWTRAASQGNADSQYNLGILYAEGEYGIRRNLKLAKYWWGKAARHGDAMAQYNLGTLYVNNGVHDYCEATRLWLEAAQRGVEQADLALRVIRRREDYKACQ